jgi:hypothetical protein
MITLKANTTNWCTYYVNPKHITHFYEDAFITADGPPLKFLKVHTVGTWFCVDISELEKLYSAVSNASV